MAGYIGIYLAMYVKGKLLCFPYFFSSQIKGPMGVCSGLKDWVKRRTERNGIIDKRDDEVREREWPNEGDERYPRNIKHKEKKLCVLGIWGTGISRIIKTK